VLVSQRGNGFQLNDNLLEADEIWLVSLRQQTATVADSEGRFRDCWNPLVFKFDLQAFVINRL
jgi:hypothetical protein